MSGFGFPPGGGPPRGPGRGGPPGTKSCIFAPGDERPQLDPRAGGAGNDFAGRSRSTPNEFGLINFTGRLEHTNDPLGLGQLGRADLDPFAPIGPGTGMLADPRGARQPPEGVPPMGTVPGARFDPYGPTPPQPPNFGGVGIPRPTPGQGQPVPEPPFGGIGGDPTPDHLRIVPFPDEDPPTAGTNSRRGPPPFGGPSPDAEPRPSGFEDMFM